MSDLIDQPSAVTVKPPSPERLWAELSVAVNYLTRFSLPFNYHGTTTNPAYIMINVTSSANQSTTVTGSKMWLDDIAVVYNILLFYFN